MFVLDASVALVALFGEAEAAMAEEVISRIGEAEALAPAHFGLQIADLLSRQVQIGALGESAAIAMAGEVARWPVVIDAGTAEEALHRTLAFAIAHRLSAWEAAYLELSLRRGAALATFDRRLATVAQIHGVRLLIPLNG